MFNFTAVTLSRLSCWSVWTSGSSQLYQQNEGSAPISRVYPHPGPRPSQLPEAFFIATALQRLRPGQACFLSALSLFFNPEQPLSSPPVSHSSTLTEDRLFLEATHDSETTLTKTEATMWYLSKLSAAKPCRLWWEPQFLPQLAKPTQLSTAKCLPSRHPRAQSICPGIKLGSLGLSAGPLPRGHLTSLPLPRMAIVLGWSNYYSLKKKTGLGEDGSAG